MENFLLGLMITAVTLGLLGLQYLLCCKIQNRFLRCIPFYGAGGLLLAAGLCLTSKPSGFLDFRGLSALLLASAAFLVALSAAAGWGIYRFRNRGKTKK